MKTTLKSKGENKMQLGAGFMTKNLGLILFVALLGVLYINNAQRGEKKLMAIDKLEKGVQENRWEYLGLKKELMEKSSPTQLAKDLDGEVVFPEKGPRILKAPKS